MDEYRQSNLKLWNEWTGIHAKSKFYDVEGFKAGKSTLDEIETGGVGDIKGKSLLHLQCHFGLSTLSFARLGAQVTGVDFSDEAITLAQSLAQELNIPATFVQSDIYKLPEVLNEKFDIVFTSYGVLNWLPDMTAWGQIVGHFLKPGGRFFIVEAHPFAYIFETEKETKTFEVAYPYSSPPDQPLKFEVQGSYADREAHVSNKVEYGWNHSLSDIMGSLLKAGLQIDSFQEYFKGDWEMFPGLIAQDADGWWRLKEKADSIPLMFSIQATKV